MMQSSVVTIAKSDMVFLLITGQTEVKSLTNERCCLFKHYIDSLFYIIRNIIDADTCSMREQRLLAVYGAHLPALACIVLL